MFPSRSIHTDGIRCGVMVSKVDYLRYDAYICQSSFGFGQVGGTALVVHPRYLFGSLNPEMYEAYKKRNEIRYLATYKAMSEMMISNALVKIQNGPPYSPDLEIPVLLNPLARASADPKGGYSFTSTLPSSTPRNLENLETFTKAMRSTNALGVGIDHGVCYILKN